MPYNKDKNQKGDRRERPKSNAPKGDRSANFSKKRGTDKAGFDNKENSDRPKYPRKSSSEKPKYPRKDSSGRNTRVRADDSERPKYPKKNTSGKPKYPRKDDSGRNKYERGEDAERPKYPKKNTSGKPKYPRKDDSENRKPERRDDSDRPREDRRTRAGRTAFADKRKPDRKRFPAKGKGRPKPEVETKDEGIRLNRYIANAGICSRREADTLISDGRIRVNGKVVTEMGTKVVRRDKVSFDGKPLRAEKNVYILLNKPKDIITSVSDDRGRKTVIDLVRSAGPERVVPVGRLDRNTTGLLLLTNDGDLTDKLTHPSHMVRKLYHVTLDKKVKDEDLEQLAKGFELEDGFIKADEVSRIEKAPNNEIGILMHSGRNRIVRRMMEHLGYEVIKLDRVLFANLTKRDLPRGRYRRLSPREVSLLKRIVGK